MSYGTNAPWGLRPRALLTGATFNNQTNQYQIASGYATSLFTGDPVQWANTGTVVVGTGGTAGAQTTSLGVFAGCEYTLNGVVVFSPYWPSGTVPDNGANATAFIIDDPNVLFDIQVASTAGAGAPTIAQTNIGLNANYAVGGAGNPAAGSTITGQSAYFLSFETLTPGTSATLNLKLVQLTPVPGNNSGVSYNNALVLINNHFYKGGTGTAGI